MKLNPENIKWRVEAVPRLEGSYPVQKNYDIK